jgi:dihydrofolate reductase
MAVADMGRRILKMAKIRGSGKRERLIPLQSESAAVVSDLRPIVARRGNLKTREFETRMRTQYYTASSLDGFIAGPGDSLDWLFPLGDANDTSYPTFIRDVGALVMGSATYEWMLRHVIGPEATQPGPWPYTQPTWVLTTRTLPLVPNADVRFARGDVRAVHREMARSVDGKNLWVVGGGELAGQFYDAGLLDDLFVQVGSVTLGAGKPLLPRAIISPPLKLISVRAVGTGFAELHYEVPKPSARG